MLGGARLAAIIRNRRQAFGFAACFLHPRALGILQREPQFLSQSINRRALPLPRSVSFKPQGANAPAPGRDDATDGAVIGAIRVLLIDPLNDVGRYADECA